MTSEEFYKAYANLPLDRRFQALDIIHLGIDTTFSNVYRSVELKDKQIRELQQEKQDIIDLAAEYLKGEEV